MQKSDFFVTRSGICALIFFRKLPRLKPVAPLQVGCNRQQINMTSTTRLAMPLSHTLAPRSQKRNFQIMTDYDNLDNDIEEGNSTISLFNNPSASEKGLPVVIRRQPTPKNDAIVEQLDSNMSDTDLALDIASGVESVASETHTRTTRSRPRIHNCTWPDCGKVYDNKAKLSEHIRTHTGEVSCEDSSIIS
jgi:hypothetical protein